MQGLFFKIQIGFILVRSAIQKNTFWELFKEIKNLFEKK